MKHYEHTTMRSNNVLESIEMNTEQSMIVAGSTPQISTTTVDELDPMTHLFSMPFLFAVGVMLITALYLYKTNK